jgi:hypothetical protein
VCGQTEEREKEREREREASFHFVCHSIPWDAQFRILIFFLFFSTKLGG